MMKSWFSLLLGLCLLGLIKIHYFPSQEGGPGGMGGPGKGGGKPGGGMPPAVVDVLPLGFQALSERTFVAGTLLPQEEVELHAEVSGRIVQMDLPEGAIVEKGRLLIKLNDADLQAQKAKVEAQLAPLQNKLDRQKQLLERGGISKEEFETTQSQLNALLADSRNLSAQIAKTEIRAPFRAEVGLRKVSPGAYVGPTTALATLVQTEGLKLDFPVPALYAHLLHKGESVQFRRAENEPLHSAKIIARDSRIDPASRAIGYRAQTSSVGELLPGDFVQVYIPLAQKTKALLIPTQAIVPVLKGQKAFVCKNGQAEERMLTLGWRDDKRVEVISGLEAGDSLILSGIMQLKSGAPVIVRKK